MPQTIDVPEVGLVEFPDSMDDQAIVGAIKSKILPQIRAEKFTAKTASMTDAQIAAEIGLPGAQNLTGGLIQGMTQEEMSKPALEFSKEGKEAFGRAVAGPLLNQIPGVRKFAEGAGRAIGGMVESMTSPAGASALAGAIIAPSVVLPEMIKGGIDEGSQKIGEGIKEGDASKIGEGATLVGMAVAPLAHPVSKAIGSARAGIPKPPVIAEIAKVAPETAKALESAVVDLQESAVKTFAEKPAELVKLPGEKPGAVSAPVEEVAPKVEHVVPEVALPPELSVVEPRPSIPSKSPHALGISSGALPKRFFEDVKSIATEWLKIGGHLPEEVKALKGEMEGIVAASDASIRMTTRDFMKAAKETYGLSELEMLGGGSRKIPVADVQLFNDYLKGQAMPSQIPDQILPVLDTMRAEMTGLSNRIASELQRQLNQLPVDSPRYEPLLDLIEKVRNNADVYMNRSYKFFDSKQKAPAWYDDLPARTRLAAEDYLIQNLPGNVTRAEAQSSMLRWLSDLRGEPGVSGSGKLGAKDLSQFMRRKSIPVELRDVLGEYNNSLVNYARSVSKMTQWVASQKFLSEVKRQGMGRFLFDEGSDPPGFNAQIAGEGSKSMSPLSGLRTSQQIADAFRDLESTPQHGAVARAYLAMNAWSKFAATGLSFMTQARNLSSRPFMAGMAGHWKLGETGRSVKAIWEDFGGSDKAWRKYLGELYELGVIGDTARSGELKAILKDAALQDVSPQDLYSWSLGTAVKKLGIKLPGEIYRLSDELGNVFGFENEKAIQRQIHPGWTDAQIAKEAAAVIREIYPVYSESPKLVQSARKIAVIGPFVNFPFQVWRTMWNSFSRSIGEIRSSNPVERAIGAKRLASQVATLGVTYGLQEIAKYTLGISNQEEEDFRRFQPSWSKNSKWLFTEKDEGELNAFNLSYLDPYSYATDNAIAVMSGIRNGDDPFEIFANVTAETFRPWVSEQMLAKSIIEARNGKTDMGREIFNPTDSSFEKTTKRIAHVVKVLEPGTIQRIQRRLIPAIRNEQPTSGQKFEVGSEVVRELTGIAVEKFDFKTGLAFKAAEFAKMENAGEDVFRKVISQTKTTTDQDMVDAYRESNLRRLELWKDLRGDYLAAIRRGVPRHQAESVMKNRGVTEKVIEQIARGRYEPLEISDSMEKRAREMKRRIPGIAIRQVQREMHGQSLDQ